MISLRSSVRIAALLAMTAMTACSPTSTQAAPEGVTLKQFLDRQTGRIMAADTDGDGRISRGEAAAMGANRPNGRASAGGRDRTRMFDRTDLDHDGYLDKAEITTVLTRRFHRMDRDGDGILTPDERMAARTRRGEPAPTDAAGGS